MSSILFSCTPRDAKHLFLGGTFQIKAKVINPQDTLFLGDSLKITFEIPDTIIINGITTILTDKISCEMGEGLCIADSSRAGGITSAILNNSCNIFANPGTINFNNVFRLSKVGDKLLGTYYVIPLKKGVYYFSSETPGYFSGISTTGSVNCRIVFDFDVLDKHQYLLQQAIGINNDLNPTIEYMASQGQGLYVFAVK